ncbi:hypothetical protein DFH27DRAFT_604826 [Peziza echinospora]|nr:hypothetical protein DFH27DRAFT_604826 [Peziza echinospora]
MQLQLPHLFSTLLPLILLTTTTLALSAPTHYTTITTTPAHHTTRQAVDPPKLFYNWDDPRPGPGDNALTVIFYAHSHFDGKANPNVIQLGQSHGLGSVDNNNVASLKVPDGYTCTLFEGYQDGACVSGERNECVFGNVSTLIRPDTHSCIKCKKGSVCI